MAGNIQSFFGRETELNTLSRLAEQAEGQFVLIYGRRRIGKSFLLQRFMEGRHGVFFQASRETEAAELAVFSDQIRSLTGLPAGLNYPSWEAALDELAKSEQRLIVILDEFSYLCEANPAVASTIQRWWDRKGKNSQVMLILCGSAQATMEQLQAYRSPLFQRFTARMHIQPLSYRDAGKFTPDLSATDKAMIFGILGGTPYNLTQWDQTRSISENLLQLFADPTSSLIDSAEYILTADLPDPGTAYRVLQAIALGKSRFAEIRDFAKVHERALPRLIDLELVERRVPAIEDPERSKRSVYVIPDPYFRFYFKFLARNRGRIERGLGDAVVNNAILPYLSDQMGFIFEEIARAFVLEEIRRGNLDGDNATSWWSSDGQHEIDIVGTGNLTPTFIGEVKWRTNPIDQRVLRNLEEQAKILGADASLPKLLIGRNGVNPSLLTLPDVRGYSAEDLYR